MDLNLLPLLLAVADERNFRAAADRLGVTRSAVSQGIRRLEDSVGVQLVMRTTRAVRLTEAGERLVESLRAPMGAVRQALEMNTDTPSGRLRLAVASIAEDFLSGPLLARFAEAHPKVTVDVTVMDDDLDIVAHGYDAGVRLGEVIEQDMIAVPVGGPQWVVSDKCELVSVRAGKQSLMRRRDRATRRERRCGSA
jgi:DNA-binding transcriptional LysR family regulator